jgi:hypothetical protein
MPACGDHRCCFQALPLDGRHACDRCNVELHGVCGVFYSEESLKYQNICHRCHEFKDGAVKEVAHTDVLHAGLKKASNVASQAAKEVSAKRAGQVQQNKCNLPPLPSRGQTDVYGKKVKYKKKNTSGTATASAPKKQHTPGNQSSPRLAEKAAIVHCEAGEAICSSADLLHYLQNLITLVKPINVIQH